MSYEKVHDEDGSKIGKVKEVLQPILQGTVGQIVVAVEVFRADGELSYITLFDSEAPQWHLLGLVRMAQIDLEQPVKASYWDEEDEDEDA